MAITNYLVHFKTNETFEANKKQLRNDAVAFVGDATIIHTHETDYYCGKSEVALKTDLDDLATVAKTGSYTDLTNKPSIPSLSGYATENYVDSKVEEITPESIGAASKEHTHSASNIISGTFDISRIPTGTTSTTVALGNHTHDASNISGLATVATSGSYNDLTDKPNTKSSIKITLTGSDNPYLYSGATLEEIKNAIDNNIPIYISLNEDTILISSGYYTSDTMLSLSTVTSEGNMIINISSLTANVSFSPIVEEATSYNSGTIKLFSDTVQSVVANAVSSTASRTYGVQLNSDGKAVVNVPWTDTTYDLSEYAKSNDLSNYLPITGGTIGSYSNRQIKVNADSASVGDPNIVLTSGTSSSTKYGMSEIDASNQIFRIIASSLMVNTTKVSLEGHTHTVSQISNLGSGWGTALTSTYAAPEVVLTPEVFREFIDTYGYYILPNSSESYRLYFPDGGIRKTQAEGGESSYRRIATKEDVEYAFNAKFTPGTDCLSSSGVWTNPTGGDGTWADKYKNNSMDSLATSTWVGRDEKGNSCFNRVGASYIYAYNGFFEQAFSSSDERLKNITAELDGYESLQNLLNLRTVKFQWKDSGKDAIGLIAQDVEKVYPELVSEHAVTGMKGISYEHMVPILISALRYMQDEINQLRNEISKK